MIRELSNARLLGEKFKTYQARRRTMNAAVRAHCRGRMSFTATRISTLPLLGVDAQMDKLVLEGKYRDVQVVISPAPRLPWPHGPRVVHGKAPKEFRIARTKGTSYTTTPYIDGTKRCQRALLREFPHVTA